jgi:hypothetical protein
MPLANPFRALLCICWLLALSAGQATAQVEAFCAEGAVIDCEGVCGGTARFDECKVCGGSGMKPDNSNAYCCEFNSSGCCATLTKGCDGICGSGKLNLGCGCGVDGGSDDGGGVSCCDADKNGQGCCGQRAKGCDGVCGSGKKLDDCGNCDGGGRAKGCDGICNSGKQLDSCGDCGGGDRAKGCDGVCDSGRIKDDCGVCGGGNADKGCDNVCNSGSKDLGCGCGVTECQNCLWISKWASYGTETQWGNSLLEEYQSDKFRVGRSAAVPGCFHDALKDDCVSSSQANSDGKDTGAAIIYSKCVDVDAANQQFGSFSAKDMATFLGAPTADIYPMFEQATRGVYEWYMDSNCKYVAERSQRPICGYAGASWSPISLIMDSNHNLTEEMTVVKFALTADQTKSYSLWKASEKAPLLVFDPKHLGGEISALQLFGSITFGGAAGTPTRYSKDFSKTWSNGYQALALLDIDRDGKIKGKELAPLALWFDKDKDAQVDTGELRSLAKENITALFYKDPKKIGTGDDVGLDVGFEKTVNGVVTIGKSLDWYTEVFSSEKEAGEALMAMGLGYQGLALSEKREPEEWMREPGLFKPRKATDSTSDVSGYWVWWQDKDEQGEKHPGIFAFNQGAKGKVQGFSVIESVLDTNDSGLKSAVRAIPALGKSSLNQKGERTLTFSVLNEFGAQAARNSAVVSADGFSMNGTTEQRTEFLKDGKMQSASVKYSWRATKFRDQPAAISNKK